MTPDQFNALLDRYGLPTVVIIIATWFLVTQYWPWYKDRQKKSDVEKSEALALARTLALEHKAEISGMNQRLEALASRTVEVISLNSQAMASFSETLNAVTNMKDLQQQLLEIRELVRRKPRGENEPR